MEVMRMSKKDIDWGNLGFGYIKTDKRYVANFKDGAWDEGALTEDNMITMTECAGVLQYAQTVFEGLKAYTTVDGRTVTFRPDLNAKRMADSAARLEMPVFPEDRFIDAVKKVVAANVDYVPPYGSGATLYLRPFMFGSSAVIGVKPAQEYQFRLFATPVGPYFKGGAKPLTIRVSDFDRAAEHYLGMEVEEADIPIAEIGQFDECGLCGTAAVISPVGKIVDHGKEICLPSGMEAMGPKTRKLYDTLTGIQMGTIEAPEGWICEI